MANLLWNLVSELPEGTHRIKGKNEHDNKKFETCGIKYKNYECYLEYTSFKNELIENNFLGCNKNNQKKFDETLMNRFFNKYRFSNHDIIKFILLLQKGIYPYENVDISSFVFSRWYIIVGWYILKILKYVSWNIWSRQRFLFYCLFFSGFPVALKRTKVKLDLQNWYWYIINVRKSYQIRNMSHYSSICKN